MAAPRFPVSVKGVVFLDGRVVLLKNERDEWELPGGRLEGEDPTVCHGARDEARNWRSMWQPRRSWTAGVTISRGKAEVVIIAYGCRAVSGTAVRVSAEHKAVGLFQLDELEDLNMPEGYRRSIRTWDRLLDEE